MYKEKKLMKHPYNILITSGYNSFEIVKHFISLKKLNVKVFVIDLKINPQIAKIAKYNISPRVDDALFLDFFIDFVKSNNIALVIPTRGDDVAFLARHEELEKSLNVKFAISSPAVIEILSSKRKTLDFCKMNGISVPEYYEVKNYIEFIDSSEKLSFPNSAICIKPSEYPDGSGKGFRIIDPFVNVDRRMFWELPSQMFYVKHDHVIQAMKNEDSFPPMLVMEYLPGLEYSVYCFCNQGVMVYAVPNAKLELMETNSRVAKIDMNSIIIDYSRRVCELFGFEYNVNIQWKLDSSGIPKLVEINPRIAGTIMLPVKAGIDLLELTVLKGMSIARIPNYSLTEGMLIKRELVDMFYIDNNEELGKV
jgi:carbamoyl-phosphate synthase large subunit